MRATIHYCLEEAIIKNYGHKKWQECLLASGLPINHSFGHQITEDLDEEFTKNFILSLPSVLNVTLEKIFDNFGEHWCCEYAPNVYNFFYKGATNTREMVLKLEKIHEMVAKVRTGAKPPQFEYTFISDFKIKVTYMSSRGLFGLYISLVKGLDKYFNNQTDIEIINEKEAIMTFSV